MCLYFSSARNDFIRSSNALSDNWSTSAVVVDEEEDVNDSFSSTEVDNFVLNEFTIKFVLGDLSG